MSDRTYAKVQAQQKTLTGSSSKSSLLQRAYACGQHTIAGGECSTCRSERSTLGHSQRTLGIPSASVPVQENISPVNSSSGEASHFGHDFSQIPIYPTDRVPSLLPKHRDHRLPVINTHRDSSPPSVPNVQTKAEVGREGGPLSAETAKRINASRSNGKPLELGVQRKLERGLGDNFADVRIHTDSEADVLNHRLNALAFTSRTDIYFREGTYQPNSITGRRLLAHELSHVLQQRSISQEESMTVGAAGDAYEQEADTLSSNIDARSEPAESAVDRSPQSSSSIQRSTNSTLVQRALPVAVEALEVALTATIVVQEQHGITQHGLQYSTGTGDRLGDPSQPKTNAYKALALNITKKHPIRPNIYIPFYILWDGNDYGEMAGAHVEVDLGHTELTHSSLSVQFVPQSSLRNKGDDLRAWAMHWRYEGDFDPVGAGEWEFQGEFEIDAFGGFRNIRHEVNDRTTWFSFGETYDKYRVVAAGPFVYNLIRQVPKGALKVPPPKLPPPK